MASVRLCSSCDCLVGIGPRRAVPVEISSYYHSPLLRCVDTWDDAHTRHGALCVRSVGQSHL
eukprot:3092726-Prymnesium_polylepis.1